MNEANGRGNKRCETCKRWQNPRSHPSDIRIKMGDCDAVVHPVIVRLGPQGAEQMPGGTYAITLADSYCSAHWAPKLAVFSGFSKDTPVTDGEVKEPA